MKINWLPSKQFISLGYSYGTSTELSACGTCGQVIMNDHRQEHLKSHQEEAVETPDAPIIKSWIEGGDVPVPELIAEFEEWFKYLTGGVSLGWAVASRPWLGASEDDVEAQTEDGGDDVPEIALKLVLRDPRDVEDIEELEGLVKRLKKSRKRIKRLANYWRAEALRRPPPPWIPPTNPPVDLGTEDPFTDDDGRC